MPALAGIGWLVGESSLLSYTPGVAFGATCRWVTGLELVLRADSSDVGLVPGTDVVRRWAQQMIPIVLTEPGFA